MLNIHQILRITSISVCAVTLLLISLQLQAKARDKQETINIWADEFTADNKNNVAQYKGNVKFTQGSITITCDEITIYYKDNSLDTLQMHSQTRTQFSQFDEDNQLIQASATSIVYQKNQDEMIFNGKAKLIQGSNIFRAESMRFNIVDKLVVTNLQPHDAEKAEKQRVFISIQPEE